MTPEAMNIAIAEHLGLPLTVRRWRFQHNGVTRDGFISHDDAEFNAYGMSRVYGGRITTPEPYEDGAWVPNYSGDLNAMHDAEKSLSYEDHCRNTDILELIIGGPSYKPATYAGASQRAEAFLRTVGKWKEAE